MGKKYFKVCYLTKACDDVKAEKVSLTYIGTTETTMDTIIRKYGLDGDGVASYEITEI